MAYVRADAAETLPKTNGFSFDSIASSQAPRDNFSFGAPNNNAGFTFTSSESVASAANFQFGAESTETMTNASEKEDKPASTTTFSFGTPLNSYIPATTGFVFTTTVAFGFIAAEKKKHKAETKISAPSAVFGFDASAAYSTPAPEGNASFIVCNTYTLSISKCDRVVSLDLR